MSALSEDMDLLCRSGMLMSFTWKAPTIVKLHLTDTHLTALVNRSSETFKLSKVRVSKQGNDAVIESDGLKLVTAGGHHAVAAIEERVQFAIHAKCKEKQEKTQRKEKRSHSSSYSIPRTARDETPTRPLSKKMAPLTAFAKSSGVVHSSPKRDVRFDSPPAAQQDNMSSPIRSPEQPRFSESPAVKRNLADHRDYRVQGRDPTKALFQSPSISARSATASSFGSPQRLPFSQQDAKVKKTFGNTNKPAQNAIGRLSFVTKPIVPIAAQAEDRRPSLEDQEEEQAEDEEVKASDMICSPSIEYKSIRSAPGSERASAKRPLSNMRALSSHQVEVETAWERQGRTEAAISQAHKVPKTSETFYGMFKPQKERVPFNVNKENVEVAVNSSWRNHSWDDDDTSVISPLRPSVPVQRAPMSSSFFGSKLRMDMSSDFTEKPPVHDLKLFKGGIKNLGNSCYMSSILQAMLSLTGFMSDTQAAFWKGVLSSWSAAGSGQPRPLLMEFLSLAKQRSALRGERVDVAEEQALQRRLLFSKFQLPMVNAFKTSTDILDLTKLKNMLAQKAPTFASWSQQDAHEFLTSFMGQLDDEMNQLVKNMVVPAPSTIPAATDAADAMKMDGFFGSPATITDVPKTDEKVRPTATVSEGSESSTAVSGEECLNLHDIMPNMVTASSVTSPNKKSAWTDELKALVQALVPTASHFESCMEMQYKCLDCSYQHLPKLEAYRDFSLHLAEESADVPSIEQLVRSFLQSEVRELNCPDCLGGTKIGISKRLVQVAPCLVLHLKRFNFDMRTMSYKKLRNPISFSLTLDLEDCGVEMAEGLWDRCHTAQRGELAKVWSAEGVQVLDRMRKVAMEHPNSGKMKYELRAVVRHVGLDLDKGHYICDIREPGAGDWMRCNDAIVTQITEEKVLKETDTPYILFYQAVA